MPIFDDYVTDTLMRDLVGHDRKPTCFLVYLWLAAEQQRRKAAVQISFDELAESIGISKSSAQGAVRWLRSRKLLIASKPSVTAMQSYSVCTPWRDAARRARSKQ